LRPFHTRPSGGSGTRGAARATRCRRESGRDAYRDLGREREEKARLDRELETLRREVGPLREREAAVGEALVTANSFARGMREEAQREAERTLSHARAEARTILSDAGAEADRTLQEAGVQAATPAVPAASRPVHCNRGGPMVRGMQG
jgi:cell division septum initiation protein DivIVA